MATPLRPATTLLKKYAEHHRDRRNTATHLVGVPMIVPAFIDDIVGPLVAPMFVLLEALAALGLLKGLIAEIEAPAGPTHIRNLAHPAT